MTCFPVQSDQSNTYLDRLDPRINSQADIEASMTLLASVNASESSSRDLQKRRNRARNALHKLDLGSDQCVEMVDILFNVLDDTDMKSMCDKLERQRGISPAQAQKIVLDLLHKPGRKKALTKAVAILDAATKAKAAQVAPKPQQETAPKKKTKKARAKPSAMKLAKVAEHGVPCAVARNKVDFDLLTEAEDNATPYDETLAFLASELEII